MARAVQKTHATQGATCARRSSIRPAHIRGVFMQRRLVLKQLALSTALAALGVTAAQAADTVKVGVLHSLSGTMAISETVLKDVAMMTIDEINASGGVLGKKI